MKANKVVFGAVSIMDISDSTVTEDTLGEGVIAYGADGERITGKMKAGGGNSGDTESTMQFATGTFVPTSADICTNPVTISGLNFEPKSLAIAVQGHETAISYIPSSGSRLVALAMGELFDDYSLRVSKAMASYGLSRSDVFSVELTQDGFILKSTDTTYGLMGFLYSYYAFG